MKERPRHAMRVAMVIALAAYAGCGLMRDATGPRQTTRTTTVVFEAEAGWEGTVRVDSVRWLPIIAGNSTEPYADDTEGTFSAWFVNLSERHVQIRYELRFFDADEFLLDHYFPLEQPVLLAPGERRRINGRFRLDIRAAEAIRLAGMGLIVRPGAPPS